MFGLPQEITQQIFKEVRKIKFKEMIQKFEEIWHPTMPVLIDCTPDQYYIYRQYVEEFELCWHMSFDWNGNGGSWFNMQFINNLEMNRTAADIFSFGFITHYIEDFVGIRPQAREHYPGFSVVHRESEMRLLPLADWNSDSTLTDTDE